MKQDEEWQLLKCEGSSAFFRFVLELTPDLGQLIIKAQHPLLTSTKYCQWINADFIVKQLKLIAKPVEIFNSIYENLNNVIAYDEIFSWKYNSGNGSSESKLVTIRLEEWDEGKKIREKGKDEEKDIQKGEEQDGQMEKEEKKEKKRKVSKIKQLSNQLAQKKERAEFLELKLQQFQAKFQKLQDSQIQKDKKRDAAIQRLGLRFRQLEQKKQEHESTLYNLMEKLEKAKKKNKLNRKKMESNTAKIRRSYSQPVAKAS